jgi:hypothetical protein
MKGSIRMALGFLIVFGAAGTIEVDPDASLLVEVLLASLGLMIAYSGVRAMRESQ